MQTSSTSLLILLGLGLVLKISSVSRGKQVLGGKEQHTGIFGMIWFHE